MNRRLSSIIIVLSAGYPLVSAAEPRVVTWEHDVRPAIERSFCVEAADVKGTTRFWPNVTGEKSCVAPNADPVAAAVSAAVTKENGRILWLFIATVGELQAALPKVDPTLRANVEHDLRARVMKDERLTRRYMPPVHAALAAIDARCADCPGPAVAPAPRSVRVDELIPYAVALIWPDRIEDQRVSLHICTGANGLSRLPNADLDLADAAFAGVFGNSGIMPPVESNMKMPMEYKGAKTEGEILDLLRKDLHEGLRHDAKFRGAFAKQLVEKAKELPVVCADCDAALK